MVPEHGRTASAGLAGLRRGGAVTELLFVFECVTGEPPALRPIAERLGLTVQAASHTYRALAREGLVEVRGGRYRQTVRGFAWLNETLSELQQEIGTRLARLDVVRTARALALADLSVGERVSLEMVDGLLSARPGGAGASRGRVGRPARKGGIVEVTELEGIVPIEPAPVGIRVLSPAELSDPGLPARLERALAPSPGRLLAAVGLEAVRALRSARLGPFVRFGVAAACREASELGVPSAVLVTEDDLPRLLAEFSSARPPALEVRPLSGPRSAPGRPVRQRGPASKIDRSRARSASASATSTAPARRSSSSAAPARP